MRFLDPGTLTKQDFILSLKLALSFSSQPMVMRCSRNLTMLCKNPGGDGDWHPGDFRVVDPRDDYCFDVILSWKMEDGPMSRFQ